MLLDSDSNGWNVLHVVQITDRLAIVINLPIPVKANYLPIGFILKLQVPVVWVILSSEQPGNSATIQGSLVIGSLTGVTIAHL